MRLIKVIVVSLCIVMVASCSSSKTIPAKRALRNVFSNAASNQVVIDLKSNLGNLNPNLIGADGPGPKGAYPITQMRAISLRFVRLDVGFQNTYNNQPVYNCQTGRWRATPFDQNINEVKLEGATPLAIVDYTPTCLANASSGNLNYAMPDKSGWSSWDSLVYQMGLKEIPNGVRIYEIWNEPDGMFFTGGLGGYLELYKHTVDALEKAAANLNTEIMVGGPALSWWDPGWMQPFLAFVAQNKLPLNFLSWHWYADDPDVGPFPPSSNDGFCLLRGPLISSASAPCYYNPNLSATVYQTQVNIVKSYLANYKQLNPILWIDEWNANAGYDQRMNTSFDAAFTSAALASVSNDQNLRMCFFNAVDTPNDPDGNWGMVYYPTDKPKPVYYSFYFWHLLRGKILKASILNPNPVYSLSYSKTKQYSVNSSFEAVATSLNNAYKIELINFEPYDPSGSYGSNTDLYNENVTIKLTNLPKGTYREYLSYENYRQIAVTPRLIGLLKSSNPTIKMTLPSESVYVITLKISTN